MKRMKWIVMVLVLLLSMAACGKEPDAPADQAYICSGVKSTGEKNWERILTFSQDGKLETVVFQSEDGTQTYQVGYDAAGRLVGMTSPKDAYAVTWAAPGQPATVEHTYFDQNGEKRETVTDQFTYDGDGNVIVQKYITETMESEVRFTYEDGLCVRTEMRTYTGEDDQEPLIQTTVATFNDKGEMVKNVSYMGDEEMGTVSYTYAYDDDGRIVTREVRTEHLGADLPANALYRHEYSYDSNGNMKLAQQYDLEGLVSAKEYTYQPLELEGDDAKDLEAFLMRCLKM